MKACLTALYLCVACFLFQAGAAEPTEAQRRLFLETKVKAEKGDAKAQFNLGFMYGNGEGVVEDEAEAVKWYRKAADQGHAEAHVHLGFIYKSGRGVVKNEAEAMKWFRKAADQGDADAQWHLGWMYGEGEGVPKDEVEAAKWFRMAADKGYTPAIFNLDMLYDPDSGGLKGGVEAVKWWRKQAENGVGSAQRTLGFMYLDGLGVTKDKIQAAKWFRKAAEKEDGVATLGLDRVYNPNNGVIEDGVEAVKWWRKKADNGDGLAMLRLGEMYGKGNGVPKDEVEAVKWYRKAAEQGFRSAQLTLGFMYYNGQGVVKDEVEAVKWWREVAEQGDASAQSNLGFMYHNGNGVVKDETEGYKWYLLAGAQGDEQAKKNISIIERAMTPAQRAEGQRLAREWKPGKATSSLDGYELAPKERLAREWKPGKATAEGKPATAKEVAESKPSGSGTGFFITDDGYIITNQHVAGEGATVRLVTAAGSIAAKVVKVDKANDVALLKAEGKFTALPVITSRGVRLGATATTVGFPNPGLQGFAPKLARGEIASLAGAQDDARHFQISAPIQPGNSGGALVDERGNVIGVVVAKLSQKAALATSGALAENVNYAVKSSYLLSFLESVPEVAAKLKEAHTKERKFEDVVKSVEQATVLVLVY